MEELDIFTSLREEVNKDFKDSYRKIMAVLKEVKMNEVEGSRNGCGCE